MVRKDALKYRVNAVCTIPNTLRKHAFSNMLKLLQPKRKLIDKKKLDIFHIFAQNIDCRYKLEPPGRGCSNKNHNLCFLAI